MAIELRQIDKQNFEECVKLSVREEQKYFVATNTRSLAQAWLHHDVARPFAIYADGAMVGFAMLAWEESCGDCYLWRFMIDQRHQRMGYGKAAMRALIDMVKACPAYKSMSLSVELENAVAEALYTSFGFARTGKIEDGEAVMRMFF